MTHQVAASILAAPSQRATKRKATDEAPDEAIKPTKAIKKEPDYRSQPDGSHDIPGVCFPKGHTFIQKIGDGSQGQISSWKHDQSGTVIAAKVVARRDKEVSREALVLRDLPGHEGVVSLKAYCAEEPKPFLDTLVFEFCPEGDLFDFQEKMLAENGAQFSEGFMWSLFRQLSSALAFLHQGITSQSPQGVGGWQPLIHRDIKLENILISSLGVEDDKSDLVVKLGDFGLATRYDPANAKMARPMGTAMMWPPEQTWEGLEATPAGDVWAVGAVLHAMAHYFPPIVEPTAYAEKVCRGDRNERKADGKRPERMREVYWDASAPRRPLPINLDPEEYVPDVRRPRPTPRYTGNLNGCLHMALCMNVEARATAGELFDTIVTCEALWHDTEKQS